MEFLVVYCYYFYFYCCDYEIVFIYFRMFGDGGLLLLVSVEIFIGSFRLGVSVA